MSVRFIIPTTQTYYFGIFEAEKQDNVVECLRSLQLEATAVASVEL